ncbi:MAG: tRNA pseudouridine(38-40) synthase TruA [Puniceicoccales bacterium]|jgi:tRNA pseudouridine38-40 synthase|nr:tRNA pseudouridine(38-40) synthase TruA [Puniceicoccales bacterium]
MSKSFRSRPVVRRDDLAPGFTRFVCTVAYDGTEFHGWQSQMNGNTIQDFLERRLSQIFHTPILIHGSGRTDAGVHARAQVFHFDAQWAHGLETLRVAVRTGLPPSIQIRGVRTGRGNFHARFSACGKRYRYHLYEGFALPMETRYCLSLGTRRVDTGRMQAAAGALLGVHDFSAFCGHGGLRNERDNPVKDLRRLDVARRGRRIVITTEASGYLYKMVRRIVGGLLSVGLGQFTPEELVAYRDAKTRLASVPSAPARGLFMEKVFYRVPANAHPAPGQDADAVDQAK